MAHDTDRWPAVLAALYDHARAALERRGVDHATADAAARELIETIRLNWGGRPLYIPLGTVIDLTRRREQIYAEWRSGATPQRLAQKYQVAVQSIYRVLDGFRDRPAKPPSTR